MPQLNGSSDIKAELDTSAADTMGIDTTTQVDGDNQSQTYKRKLRSRTNTSIQDVVQEAPIKKPTKRKLKQTKSAPKCAKPRRPPSAKKNPSDEIEERVLQQVKEEIDSEDDNSDEDEEEGSSDTSPNRTFLSCSVCNTDFSSAFILRLHLKIHEKVGNTVVVKEKVEENTSTVPSSQSQETIKSELYDDTDSDSDSEDEVGTTDIEEPNIKVEPNIKLEDNNKPVGGILSKNFVENLKKNLSLAMNKNQ